MSVAEMQTVIEKKERGAAGDSVHACGLYLTEVKYPYILEGNYVKDIGQGI